MQCCLKSITIFQNLLYQPSIATQLTLDSYKTTYQLQQEQNFPQYTKDLDKGQQFIVPDLGTNAILHINNLPYLIIIIRLLDIFKQKYHRICYNAFFHKSLGHFFVALQCLVDSLSVITFSKTFLPVHSYSNASGY